MNYKAAVKVLVMHKDITTFSGMFDRRLAPITQVAKAAGMSPVMFERKMKTLDYSDEQISLIAAHFDLTKTKVKELIAAEIKNRQ